MRRLLVGVLCLLSIAPWTGVGAEPVTDVHSLRTAWAVWWTVDGDRGTERYLAVYESLPSDASPRSFSAYYVTLRCGVGKQRQPVRCDYSFDGIRKVKVVSFEMDPLLFSAHAVVDLGNRRADVTWEGRGEYNDPSIGQTFEEVIYPPSYVGVDTYSWVSTTRPAAAVGDLNGIDLSGGLTLRAEMAQSVYTAVEACAGEPECVPTPTP